MVAIAEGNTEEAKRQAKLANERHNMRGGMSFSIVMRFPGEAFPAVNPLAIQWSADGSFVWVPEDGKAKKVMARIVQRNSDGVLVDAELAAGQPVITEGVLQLQEGMQVRVLNAEGGGSEGGANARPSGEG